MHWSEIIWHFAHLPIQIYTESLLCSGEQSNIQLAASHLTLSPSPSSHHNETAVTEPAASMVTTEQGPQFRLSHSLSVQLVVGAAKEYFNSASSLMDSEMDLARYVDVILIFILVTL